MTLGGHVILLCESLSKVIILFVCAPPFRAVCMMRVAARSSDDGGGGGAGRKGEGVEAHNTLYL